MFNGPDTVCSCPTTTRAGRLAPIVWTTSNRGGLGDQLVVEWRRLRRAPSAIGRARALGVTAAPFDDLDGLLRLAGFGAPASPASDAVLLGLVRRADDDLAARIVLQRILPGLLAVAAAEQHAGDHDAALSEIVGEAWMAIRSYGPARPGTAIPARLLNDARHRAFTGPRRRHHLATVRSDLQRLAAPDHPHPFAELTMLLVDARDAGLDTEMLATARLLLGHESVNAAAHAAGVTARSVRYRRRALVAELRSLLDDGEVGSTMTAPNVRPPAFASAA